MREEDEEAERSADGYDDADAVEGEVVGFLLGGARACAGGECGVVIVIVGIGDGTVWRDEIARVIIVVIVGVVIGVPPPGISTSGRCGECACDDEAEPEEEVAGYVCGWVDWSITG